MPLLKGKSEEIQRKNHLELMLGRVGEARHKALATIVRKRGVSYEEARRIQSAAILRK